MKEKIALVLQGGGTRGAFTSGVLDAFMEKGIEFDAVLGVSAGSLNGQNFVSKQIYRNKWACTELMLNKKFISKWNFFKYRSMFNFDYYFKEGEKDFPFDEKVFFENKTRFFACATNCLDGQGIYFEKGVCSNMIKGIEASSSLPLLCAPVKVDGVPCLDGGIAVVAPLRKALELGYKKVVVVLTRHKGYRKQLIEKKYSRLARFLYGKYKKFLKEYDRQHEIYNEIIDEIETKGDNKEIFVIQPEVPITLGRTEIDPKRILELYEVGYKVGSKNIESMLKYMNE